MPLMNTDGTSRHHQQGGPAVDDGRPAASLSGSNNTPPQGTTTMTNTVDRCGNDWILLSSSSKASAWPPWPFSWMPKQQQGDDAKVTHSAWPPWPFCRRRRSSSSSQVLWRRVQRSVKASMRNAQQLASGLYRHLPPCVPPLLILAGWPVASSSTTLAPLGWHNAVVRSWTACGVGVAIVSWAHTAYRRRQTTTMTPLALHYQDVSRAILPPFLPEPVVLPWNRNVGTHAEEVVHHPKEDESTADDMMIMKAATTEEDIWLPRRLRRHWKHYFSSSSSQVTSKSSTASPFSVSRRFRGWREARKLRKLEVLYNRRRAVYDELVALRTLKEKRQKAVSRRTKTTIDNNSNNNNNNGTVVTIPEEPVGYALVTGASQGIGRAIAVELARWEIPLILVARNLDKLIALANDLEQCYGVRCCVLQADLSKPRVAEYVYRTTQEARLVVDMLVNNAGASASKQEDTVDQPLEEVQNMMYLNVCAGTVLSHLYGRDMKQRKRGRILILSSVCGAVGSIPSVTVYSATKAFQNSLAMGLTKELEPHGVGVTCIMPGAVKGTAFAANSRALCWKLPFYPRSTKWIAKLSVQAMLRGDVQVLPGWQNRIFIKVLKPILPPRWHSAMAETAWKPIWPFGSSSSKSDRRVRENETAPRNSHALAPERQNAQRVPRLLQMDPEAALDDEEYEETEAVPERTVEQTQQTSGDEPSFDDDRPKANMEDAQLSQKESHEQQPSSKMGHAPVTSEDVSSSFNESTNMVTY